MNLMAEPTASERQANGASLHPRHSLRSSPRLILLAAAVMQAVAAMALLQAAPPALTPPVSGADAHPKLPSWMDADPSVKVFLSQYGYNPEHPKIVNYKGEGKEFVVRNAGDHTIAFRGPLHPVTGDFGTFQQGDFTGLRTPGEYYVEIGQDRSPSTFTIAPNLWDNLQKASAWYYFGLRRIGEDNVMGNLGDYRLVNWEHGRIKTPAGDAYKYIGRAWGDGDDGRIYPSSSLIVAQYCALKESKPFWDRGDWIYSQVRWGLDGALSFLEKNGQPRLMLGAFPEHQDTTFDNLFHSGDEKLLDDCFNQKHTANEYSATENREAILTSLLIGPAYSVYLFRYKDPEFFGRVERLVKEGYSRIESTYHPYPQKYSLGSWVWLNLLMWKMTGEQVYCDRAVSEADRLMQLQQTTAVGDDTCKAKGWFHKEMASTRNPWGEKPEQEVMLTPWIYQGLLKLIEYLPEHPKAAVWRQSVKSYASDYLLAISRENSFGFTPMKVEASATSTLKRHRGDLSYQYFAQIGRHFHQIGNSAFMMQVGKLMKDQDLINGAWQQVFWFSGNNPSGLSLINGFGKNTPTQQYFATTLGRSFPGGISNGAVGDAGDNPDYLKYNEYYSYGNLNVLWLATAIGSSRFESPLELWPREIRESPHSAHPEQHPPASFPVRMKGGFTYPFTAVVRDDPDNAVEWSVDGVPGGNAQTGTIDEKGSYAAPPVAKETKVTIAAASRKDPTVHAQTQVTILPVPAKVANLRASVVAGKVELSWDPVPGKVSGYTIWRRLPATGGQVGTIFEMVGSIGPETASYTYPNGKIRYYDEATPLAGTEFMVKAYAMKKDPAAPGNGATDKTTGPFALKAAWINVTKPSSDRIYGFGPDSGIVKIP